MTDTTNKRWAIIQDILTKEGIARQHLNSFDEFLRNGLQEIINEVSQIEIENAEYPYKIQLGKIKHTQPRMMQSFPSPPKIISSPANAKIRSATSVPIMVSAAAVPKIWL